MSLMLEFYGLREQPFGVSPNPRFFYPSVQHREALASLILGIENQVGFAVLIAEAGTGKTTLLFDLLLRYRDRASTAFVFNTQCSGLDLLRNVVMELQIPGGESEQDPVRLHQLFTEFVADPQRTKPVLIIIDEAHNLEDSALEMLRLLSNCESPDRKLAHIILAGQPLLGEKLHSRSLAQLLQRVTSISRLQRLSPAQTEECVEYRLRVAGYTGQPLFSAEAMAKLNFASGGVPRAINRICINALQLGFALGQTQIGVEVIEEVLSDLDFGGEPRRETSEGVSRAESQSATIEPSVSNIPVEPRSGAQDLVQPAPRSSPMGSVEAELRSIRYEQHKRRSEISIAAIAAVLCVVIAAALLFVGVTGSLHLPKLLSASNPSPPMEQPVPEKQVTTVASVLVEQSARRSSVMDRESPGLRNRQAKQARRLNAVAKSSASQRTHKTPLSLVRLPARVVPGQLLAQPTQPTAPNVAVGRAGIEPSIRVTKPEQSAMAKPSTSIPVQQNETNTSEVVKQRVVPSVAISMYRVASSQDNARKLADDRKPVLAKFVLPVYPAMAKQSHIAGDVSLQVAIASDGSVQDIRVLSGNSLLAGAAKDAVLQWRYRPAQLNGTPTPAEAKIVVTFQDDDYR